MIAFYHNKISPIIVSIFESIKYFLLKSMKFIIPVAILLFVFFPATMIQIIGALFLIVISVLASWFILKLIVNIFFVLLFGSFYVISWILGFVLLFGGLAWISQFF